MLPVYNMRQLLEAGVHFGHQTHRWNPKMRNFIFGKRNNIHIVDLTQTVPLLHQALKTVRDVVAQGGRVLFVGTPLCYFLLAGPFGVVADRVGPRRLFVAGHIALLLVYGLLWQGAAMPLVVGACLLLLGATLLTPVFVTALAWAPTTTATPPACGPPSRPWGRTPTPTRSSSART